jgi:hypothetical protein
MRAAWEQHRHPHDPAAGLTLLPAESGALADAARFYLRRRFHTAELDVDDVLRMRVWGDLADRLEAIAAEQAGATLVLGVEDVRRLREAAIAYVAQRDVESYQPPPERERLAVLRAVAAALGETLAAVPVPAEAPQVPASLAVA